MSDPEQTYACDVLVAGSGAGGLAAAVTAGVNGLSVLVVEKDSKFGGTTATAGGSVWVPCSPSARRQGVNDSIAEARMYLEHCTTKYGSGFDAPRIDVYLANAPKMMEFMEENTRMRFAGVDFFPDYHPELPGAKDQARTVGPAVYDSRELPSALRANLKWPWLRVTFAGIQVNAASGEQYHFYHASRSLRSAAYVALLLVKQVRDLLMYGRSRRLVNGNALVGRLAGTCHDLGIPIWVSTPAVELIRDGERVQGAVVVHGGKRVRVEVRCGVVLACGGFSNDPKRQKELYPHVRRGAHHYPVMTATDTGDGARMAEAIGAQFSSNVSNAAAWAPVTPVPQPNGRTLNIPHHRSYAKSGIITVTRRGTRFTNDACSYHDMVQAMIKACYSDKEVDAFGICDHPTLRRHGFGTTVRPYPYPIWPHIRRGYLFRAKTIADLAHRAGIDPDALVATVERFNRFAREGKDPDFGRGESEYDRYWGDPGISPNPSLAPILTAPFYALRFGPGDIGSFAGLKTDTWARVLDVEGKAIDGLYAAGSDMESIFGGDYPGGGSNIGPGMTFGYIAALHMAGKEIDRLG